MGGALGVETEGGMGLGLWGVVVVVVVVEAAVVVVVYREEDNSSAVKERIGLWFWNEQLNIHFTTTRYRTPAIPIILSSIRHRSSMLQIRPQPKPHIHIHLHLHLNLNTSGQLRTKHHHHTSTPNLTNQPHNVTTSPAPASAPQTNLHHHPIPRSHHTHHTRATPTPAPPPPRTQHPAPHIPLPTVPRDSTSRTTLASPSVWTGPATQPAATPRPTSSAGVAQTGCSERATETATATEALNGRVYSEGTDALAGAGVRQRRKGRTCAGPRSDEARASTAHSHTGRPRFVPRNRMRARCTGGGVRRLGTRHRHRRGNRHRLNHNHGLTLRRRIHLSNSTRDHLRLRIQIHTLRTPPHHRRRRRRDMHGLTAGQGLGSVEMAMEVGLGSREGREEEEGEREREREREEGIGGRRVLRRLVTMRRMMTGRGRTGGSE